MAKKVEEKKVVSMPMEADKEVAMEMKVGKHWKVHFERFSVH